MDFISLCKLGVGSILIRHSEIIGMEPTPLGFTNLTLSTGEHLIVEEGPIQILKLIKNLEDLTEKLDNLKESE